MNQSPVTRIKHRRQGISLLEVMISIAILAMSSALLATIIQHATNNAMSSRDELQASLICESKLAEIALQILPMQSGDWVQVTDQTFANKVWYYRIDALQSNQPDIMAVTVSVGDDFVVQNNSRPTSSLTRWFINPALNMDIPAAEEATSGTTGSTASSGGSL